MTEEYWIEYYDDRNRRYNTTYYVTQRQAEVIMNNLEEQGYHDVTLHIFRY
jgi:hypothetical protein